MTELQGYVISFQLLIIILILGQIVRRESTK